MAKRKYQPTLKPLTGKKTRKPPKFAVCDVEAHDWIDFKLMGFYDGEEYHEFRTMYDFVEYTVEARKRKNITEIYAHFGGIYDNMFILKELIRENYIIEGMVPRGSGLLCFSYYPKGQEHLKITVKDSSALFPFGLSSLTESFKVTHIKQEFDFASWDGSITPELCEYLRYDCIGLWEAIEAYRKWPLIAKAGHADTMASQAVRVLRLFMFKEMKALGDKVDEFVRLGYFGGRTEIFKPFYKGKKPLYCYDVNSLYPTVMLEDMPGNFKKWTTKYDPDCMGFFEATVQVPKDMKIPPLPTVQTLGKSTKLIFPTGTFSGVWSTVELEYAKSLGVKVISTGTGAVFENYGGLFRKFVNTLYEMRLEAKSKGDGVGSTLTKILLNSCYGRMGLDKDKEELLFDDFSSGLSPHCEIEVDGKIYPIMKRAKRLEKTFTNVAVAAWVTSLARIHMHRIYMECGDELYYTDTDSIFTTKWFESGDGLGELKEEYRLDKAVFLLPKTYLVENSGSSSDPFKKVAMKGFSSRKIQHFKFDDFFTALEGDLRHMRVLHDEKLATMRTAMKRFGKILAKMPEQEKGLNSYYDKRRVFRSGKFYDSNPLHIIDGMIQ